MTTKNFVIDDLTNVYIDEILNGDLEQDTNKNPLLKTAILTEDTDELATTNQSIASDIVSKEPQNVNNDGHLQTKRVKVLIDNFSYQKKPSSEDMAKITARIIQPKNIKEITLKELSEQITSGHVFTSSYANAGASDDDFISADIVCLDFDGDISIKEVLNKLEHAGITANIVYYTYSHGNENKERFRVVTALTERVTDRNEYKHIIKGYMSLFSEKVDNATVALVQRFLGTNKGLARDIDEYNTTSKQILLDLYTKEVKRKEQEQAEKTKQQAIQPKPKESISINGFDLSAEIDRYNLLDYIKQTYPTSTLKPASGGFYLNPCPLCGHNNHLHITGNKFHSFGDKNCLAFEGVGIVQWLMYSENLTVAQAIAKFKYELLGIDEKQDKAEYAKAMRAKEQAERPKSDNNNQKNSNGKQSKPYFKIESLESELNKRDIKIRYNIITCENEYIINGKSLEVTENLATNIYSDLCDQYIKISKILVESYLCCIAEKNKYNPVLDIFNANQWDKQDHLSKVYEALNIADDDSLSKTLLLKWFWQGHALLRNNEENPYGADGVLTLTGNQGMGKTSFFRHMALYNVNSNFFKEGQTIKSLDKDTIRRCHTAFISELGELGATFRASDIEELKAFITQSKDQYRLPYGHKDIKKARRCNLSATVNEKNGEGFLVDQTGNRRFWTISIKDINLEKLQKINALQVWLQIWEQYAKHNLQGFRLTKDEQQQLAQRNGEHERKLKGEEEIIDILSMAELEGSGYTMEYITASQFKMEHDILRGYSVEQIGRVLDKLGRKKEYKRIDGNVQKVRRLPKRTYPNFQ